MKNLYYAKIDGKTDEFELMAYNLLSALLEYGKDSQLAKDILLIAKRKD
jgi:negative regulator of genetic competence, sporulation and motility